MTKDLDFKKVSEHDTPDVSPGFLLWRVSTTWRSILEKALLEIGLTHPQFVILATLGWLTRNGDKVTQALVGKMAGLDPNTVSQIIRGLEKKELIKRVASSDARAKNPLLTKKGSTLLKKAIPLVESKDAEFFKLLSKGEVTHMLGLFQKLIR